MFWVLSGSPKEIQPPSSLGDVLPCLPKHYLLPGAQCIPSRSDHQHTLNPQPQKRHSELGEVILSCVHRRHGQIKDLRAGASSLQVNVFGASYATAQRVHVPNN